MKITERYGLPFVSMTVMFRERPLTLTRVLLDTGSAGTLLNADAVQQIGMVPEENDLVDMIRGVGGVEYVYTKNVDAIWVGESTIKDFQVEIGNMDYGLELDGILGFNFLKQAGAVINVQRMVLSVSNA